MQAFIDEWLFDPTVGKIITAFLGVLLIVVLVKILQRTISRQIQSNDVRHRTRKFISFFGYLVAILLLTTVFSDKLGGLTVVLGVAGAGVAFALQEVIASFAGWFAISFGNFYKTGDRVELGGIRGDVIDIGILRTTLMELGQWVKGDLYNGRIVRVANSFVFKEPVFNYSTDFPFLWDEIEIPVKYGSDYKVARKLLEEVIQKVIGNFTKTASETWDQMTRKYLIEKARIEPMVTIVANDNWVVFTVRYIVDYRRRRVTKDQLFQEILARIEQTDGAVQLASATFEIVGLPDLKVTLNNDIENGNR